MLKLKIKLVFKNISILFFINTLFCNVIYIDNPNSIKWYFVSTYMKDRNIQNLYDYNFDLRLSKGDIEISYKYCINKQITANQNNRTNEFNLFSFKYLNKNKLFIIGPSIRVYQKYNQLNTFYSATLLISKHFNGYDTTLSYYPYLEYEFDINSEEDALYIPNFLYIGCVIKDENLFVEPFFRINNFNNNKYTGIKLGFEI